jgi:hypothetical protein
MKTYNPQFRNSIEGDKWTYTMLVVRWNHLSREAWMFDEPADEHWHGMMDEKLEIENELEKRGYLYDLQTNKWFHKDESVQS